MKLLQLLAIVVLGRIAIAQEDQPQWGCDCENDDGTTPPCLIGGRLYWSHEGIDATLKTWVQAAFVPVANGGGEHPTQITLQCTGDFLTLGQKETKTFEMIIPSDVIQGSIMVFELQRTPDVETPIGQVDEYWGSGVLENIEVGTWAKCCWSGNARYNPLENARECADWNLCFDVDLRATNEGPKPRGSGGNSGKMDRLWEDGFVVASVCQDTSIDLEAIDESESDAGQLFNFDKTPFPGTNAMASVNGVEPTLNNDGFFEWALDDPRVQVPQEGLDGVFSVNVEVREQEDAGPETKLNGTMIIDFIVALDPTRPICSFSGIEESYSVGETVTGLVTVDDRGENNDWRSAEDLVDITQQRSSGAFTARPPIPIIDASTGDSEIEVIVTAVCTTDGPQRLGVIVTDTCGHQALCEANYLCIALPTEAPTAHPTASPTDAPTAHPTDLPTSSPTSHPTEAPTSRPTDTPTEHPTAFPTEAPTAFPTAQPTEHPTSAPTDPPTDHPTSSPTEHPTEFPTDPPTDHPTAHPTESPTDYPTEPPTRQPTEQPTSPPTERPTEIPTEPPTSYPTDLPTDPPTAAPTDAPTDAPTEKPIKAGCVSFVDPEVYYMEDGHWVVPVNWTFEADFTFTNRPPYVIHNRNRAPNAYEDPEIPRRIETEDYTVNAFYDCTAQTNGAPGEYLKLEYGFSQPVSGYCDTAFECCDIGCVFETDNPEPACGEEFRAKINIYGCPKADITMTELTNSRADIVNIDRPWANGDTVSVNFQCPEVRSDKTTIVVEVADQYGGRDTCELNVECEHCLKTCECPMCAPMEKAWVCYVDGDGNIALHAFTRQEIEDNESHIFYPTETYKNTAFDCWCDPVMDFPSGDSVYMCHYDYRRNEWMLTSVHRESRPGPLNDMQDYLDIGDGFPGHYNTNHISGYLQFLDLWCQIVE